MKCCRKHCKNDFKKCKVEKCNNNEECIKKECRKKGGKKECRKSCNLSLSKAAVTSVTSDVTSATTGHADFTYELIVGGVASVALLALLLLASRCN